MTRNFREALENRRTYYALGNEPLVEDDKIREVLDFAIKHIPSAFNSQSSRVALLLGDQHLKLWEIVKSTLQKMLSPESFTTTESKINSCFQAGYGTVLFFEDMEVVEALQTSFPSYSENFPVWSLQSAGMHQLAIWTMLEDLGFGASLQHYNPIIDEEVRKTWDINPKWKLMAQMPFGVPLQKPGEKEFKPLEDRVIIFK